MTNLHGGSHAPYLLDHLLVGAHSELFADLIYLRIGLGLGSSEAASPWYVRMLDEAKREALAMQHPKRMTALRL